MSRNSDPDEFNCNSLVTLNQAAAMLANPLVYYSA